MNYLGFKTLYKKEVRRFLKVYNQTIIAPMVNSLLFLAIFSLALGDRVKDVSGIPFQQFMVPGLIMMTIVQNAFANTSSSFIMGKVLGTIIDYLIPPISAGEMTLAMVLGGITRGICAGLSVAVAASFFVEISIHNFWLLIFYAIFASALLATLGLLAGIFAETFDQMAAITSYIITPLAFLSGTFYSINNLPQFWQYVSHANPFFYMIDGFRYSMTGHHDGNLATGMSVIIIANILLFAITYKLVKAGYRIKS